MNPEKFHIPTVEGEEIDPQKKLSERSRTRSKERMLTEDSLSQFILRWWKGDAHSHSKESTREGFGYAEGIYDLREMLEYYKKLGLDFVCFAEHASKPGAPERQSVDNEISQSILSEAKRISTLNKEPGGDIAALSGIEANIFFDKSGKPILDIPDEVLQKLDLVIASRHQIDKEKDPDAIKESLLFAINNPNIDVIGHPDRYTREDKEKSTEYWEKYWGIWPEILQEMAKNNKAFEINLNNPPSKKLIEIAAQAGLKFFINYDAHDFNQYKKEKTDLTITGEEAKKRWAEGKLSEHDYEILAKYKSERLSSGPGVKAILRLIKWIQRLNSYGVTPDRVINSSKDNLLSFLTKERGKDTENLNYLINK